MIELASGEPTVPSWSSQNQSEEEDKVLLDLLPQMIWTMHADGTHRYFNAAWRNYTGLHPDLTDRSHWIDWAHPDDRDRLLNRWARFCALDSSFKEECRLRHQSGEYRFFAVQVVSRQREPTGALQWIGSCTDVHEYRLQQIALANDSVLQREMLDASIDCIKVIRPSGRLSTMNRSGCIALGVSEDSGFGMEWLNLLPPEIRIPGSAALDLARKGENARFPGRSQLPGQEPQYWDNLLTPMKDANGTVTTIMCVSREVTLERKAEEALIRSEKLAAVGRLAASISHEINNPLEAVTNLLYLLDQESHLSPEGREFLQQAQAELARVSQIAIQTLQFYRQSTHASQLLLENQLDTILGFYKTKLHSASITVFKRYRHRVPVVAFEGELRQVFTSLIGNAIDALVNSGQMFLGTRFLRREIFGRDYVVVTIADNGTGMCPATLAKSFEPFFSTKGVTSTGLGLWITKSIIEKHGGMIRARSSDHDSKHGSVFMVWIPTTLEDNASAAS